LKYCNNYKFIEHFVGARLERIFHLGENNGSIFRLIEGNALTGAESVDDFGRVDLEGFDEQRWI
jgi:hypothetical protein